MRRIKRSTEASQWNYVPTDLNPADHVTRALSAAQLSSSSWFSGPAFLCDSRHSHLGEGTFNLIDPESDAEVRPQAISCATVVSDAGLGSGRFKRFSTWRSLQNAISRLSHIAHSFSQVDEGSPCHGWHPCKEHLNPDQLNQAKATIIRFVQMEAYADEVRCLENGQTIPRSSPLNKFRPLSAKTVFSGSEVGWIKPSSLLMRHTQ